MTCHGLPAPTRFPTRVAAAAPNPKGIMNVKETILIATPCAASSRSPSIPIMTPSDENAQTSSAPWNETGAATRNMFINRSG